MRSFSRAELKTATSKGKEMCSSCFRETGYCCILCLNPFCNRCSVFEEDEGSPGWVMGRSVAYCPSGTFDSTN